MAQQKEAKIAFMQMMNLLSRDLAGKGIRLPKERLVIADVGAGDMVYGTALEAWAQKQAGQVKILAIDRCYVNQPFDFYPKSLPNRMCSTGSVESGITQIPNGIETALQTLKALGMNRIDLITLFEPDLSMPVPQVSCINELCRNTPIIGALFGGSLREKLTNSLAVQGYRVEFQMNPYSDELQRGFYSIFDPLFVALPRSNPVTSTKV